ncbi:MAG: DUF6786 family protein [Jejuia sp.]
MLRCGFLFSVFLCAFSCSISKKNNYQQLLESLEAYNVIELTSNNGQSRLIISTEDNGKIIASTHNGLNGSYNGWVNKLALTDNSKNIGGEERLWIGPLGSQFSFYFQQIEPLHDDNWKVPDPINTESYNVISRDKDWVELHKTMQLTNYIGTTFNFQVNRKISMLSKEIIQKHLKINLNRTIKYVAFETQNTLTSLDTVSWTKENGLVGLWSAGMYQGTDDTVVIIPLKTDANTSNILTYLAPLDSTRLLVKNNVVLFKADSKYRSKIGIPPEIAPDIYGCFSKTKNRLTIIQYQKDNDRLYSNSFVEILDEPYKGEAIPIYNHSENFFELESNAPLKALRQNETTSHWHRVYHFSDNYDSLNEISQNLLGVNLKACVFE